MMKLLSTDRLTFRQRLNTLKDLLKEVNVTDIELTKSITQPGTVTILLQYQTHMPYLPPDIHFLDITVNILDISNYKDTIDTIIQLQGSNIDFDSDGL